MSRVSIKDIARRAGVSHSTVSRALSDSPQISAETKERIRRLTLEMGYSPDAQARSLVLGRTHSVGIVVTTVADPFIAEVVQGIENSALDHGYSVILTSSNSESSREMAAVEMLRSKRVDGVIVTSSRVGAFYQEHLERLGVPIVLINSQAKDGGRYTFSVTVDNQHGAFMAAEHLVELGHHRIAYVRGPRAHGDDEERLAGYQEALAEAGIEADPALVVPGDGRASGGAGALAQLLALEQQPTAVLCYNDMTAIGLLRAASKAGLRVPEDLAVVGFDDIPLASYAEPPLTSIAQPKRRMGELAFKMVLALIEGDEKSRGDISDIVVQGRLVARQSTGAGARAPSNEFDG